MKHNISIQKRRHEKMTLNLFPRKKKTEFPKLGKEDSIEYNIIGKRR